MNAHAATASGGRRETASDLRRTVRLFRRFMGGPQIYLAGVFLLVVEAVTAVVEPYPIAYLIDFLQGVRPSLTIDLGISNLLESEWLGTILVLTIAIIAIAAINSAADSLTEVCMARGGRSLGYSIRVAMYSHLQRLPLAYHDSKRTGDVLTRVTGDVLVVEEFIVQSVSNILGSLLVLVGSFAFLFYQSWHVAIIALVVVPLLAVLSDYFSRRIKTAAKTQRSREGELASTAQEMLTSIRLVQSYGRGTVDLARFADQTARSMRASLSAATIQAQFSFVIAIAEALAICAVIWLGVWLVDRNALTIGTLVLFVLLLHNMFKPARKIVSEWYKIGKVFASVERIDDLLGREVGVEDVPGARPAPPLRGRLTFQNVSFAYPAEYEDGSEKTRRPRVLRNVSFDVSPGEVVALVGPSGAGKSTIAQLIPRLYDVDWGEVLVDGLPLCTLTLASLRSQVSLVLQETMLLSGSVAENIGYGLMDATMDDIEAAARQANAHDFIMELPNGYATELGERGSTLSGGQRQRLGIARAFIRRAPILILDEPTTGLDAESAQVVVAALRGLMRGKTTILISHDPALIRCADRVLAITGGRVLDAGRPETLGRPADHETDGAAISGVHTPSGNGAHAPRTGDSIGLATRQLETADQATGPRRELFEGLRRKLPGVAHATDPDFVAETVAPLLRGAGTTVDAVAVEKMWLRTERTFTLRYLLRLSDGKERRVLGRVHRTERQASMYLERSVRPLIGATRAPPWRELAAVGEDRRLVVHAFPIDPELPTLAQACDPAVIGRLTRASLDVGADPEVSVVRHARQGGCVLKYDFPGDGEAATSAGLSLFGKVYADGEGVIADGFLAALHERARDPHISAAAFPTPVLYEPSLRLLVTAEIPGVPLIHALRAGLSSGRGAAYPGLTSALEASGRALSALHRSNVTAAPVHTSSAELDDLRRQVQLIARIWPDVANDLQDSLDLLADDAPGTSGMVLSHGDFTPSQLLIDGEQAAVVDLGGLSWSDPARDLGRFIAQLELVVMKVCGEGDRSIANDLGDAFLRGYRAAIGGQRVDGEARRIDFYRRASLVRSALHACRQLKMHRVEMADRLLDSIGTLSGRT